MLWKSSIKERTQYSSGRARAMLSRTGAVTRLILVAMGMLLQGTGLAYSQAGTGTGTGTGTVAIAAAGPVFGTLERMGAPNGAGRPSLGSSSPASAGVTPFQQAQLPAVAVTAAGPPTAEELAGDSLSQFINHHATTHNFSNPLKGNLGRWRGGMQSICPATTGLSAIDNAFVTSRLRAVAEYVGAPVQSDPKCLDNVTVVFTDNPEQAMQGIVSWAQVFFRRNNRFEAIKRLIAYTNDHAVEGWYFTTRGGARALTTEIALLPINLLPIWPQIEPRNNGGDTNGIGAVVLIVDVRKIQGAPIGAIADYLAEMSLSVIQSPDHCDPLPSILDLLSSSCGARKKPTALTAGDLAFLKALYYKNTGLGPSMSRADINSNMMRQFKLL